VDYLNSLVIKHKSLRSELNFATEPPCPSWELEYTDLLQEVPDANEMYETNITFCEN
jgi:hypothetical protein